MILGIGHDHCAIARIAKIYARYGARFMARLFTAQEQAMALKRTSPQATLAKRFAAKEAVAKALGTGISQGVNWRDIGVVTLPSGQPTIILTGGARERLNSLTPAGFTPRIHLSLSDEESSAHAFVVIEAVPL
jgi:holo-[acyl-carrier protein] synthase